MTQAMFRYWPLADSPYVAFDVAFGCKADMTFCAANVCFCPKADMAFVVANLKIEVENFRALSWFRSLNRFFQRAFPHLRLRILSGFQCRVRYGQFAMLQTSEPHAVKGAGPNFFGLRGDP
jgi:hypothetical protein